MMTRVSSERNIRPNVRNEALALGNNQSFENVGTALGQTAGHNGSRTLSEVSCRADML